MATEAQSAAQHSLTLLEQDFIQYSQKEQNEIAAMRHMLRKLVHDYGATASLAIIAAGFEVAIQEKQ